MGCGDLRNALKVTSEMTEAYPELKIHCIDDSASILARNILIVHIVNSDGFDPTNPNDLQYIWDVWYSLQWNEVTKKRFIKDVKLVLAGQWAASRIIIQEPGDVEVLYKVCTFWMNTASNRLKASQIEEIVTERYM